MKISKAVWAGVGMALCVAASAGVGASYAHAASATAPAASAPVIKPVIMPHRALYRMTLDSVRNGSQIQAVDGMMYYDWQDACDGWNVEQRLNLKMTRDEGAEVEIKSNYTTWESKDGTRFRFNYRNTLNGQVAEEYKGTATLSAPGQKGNAVYALPEGKEVVLPVGSYFPTSHTEALLAAAAGHKPFFSANVFDGTDEHGLSVISAVIGQQRDISVETARTGLGNVPAIAWPVRMAFFPFAQQEAEPDYEMDTTILPNGVSEFMLMDYGEFRLRGTLEKIELLTKPDC